MRLFFLSGGTLDVDRAVIHAGDDSRRRVALPVMQLVVQSEGRTILVDTGCPICAAGDVEGLKREYGMDPTWIKPLITREERVDAQLPILGLKPSDLELVVSTHFHFDHAGGNALFPGVPIAVQEEELAAARESDDYLPVWDAPGVQFRAVRGDWSPLPGVEMLFTPGHTEGHQSMLVRLTEQPWLFTFDAVYIEEHWREGKLGPVKDIPRARASVQRLHQVASRENARLVFGHDMAQWESLRKAPDFYE